MPNRREFLSFIGKTVLAIPAMKIISILGSSGAFILSGEKANAQNPPCSFENPPPTCTRCDTVPHSCTGLFGDTCRPSDICGDDTCVVDTCGINECTKKHYCSGKTDTCETHDKCWVDQCRDKDICQGDDECDKDTCTYRDTCTNSNTCTKPKDTCINILECLIDCDRKIQE